MLPLLTHPPLLLSPLTMSLSLSLSLDHTCGNAIGAERESSERTRAERERQRSEREHDLGGGGGGIGGGGAGGDGGVTGGLTGGGGGGGGGGIGSSIDTIKQESGARGGGSGASPVPGAGMGNNAPPTVALPPPSHQRRVPLTSGSRIELRYPLLGNINPCHIQSNTPA